MVTIRDAAAPDHRGLLQPLLKRYQAPDALLRNAALRYAVLCGRPTQAARQSTPSPPLRCPCAQARRCSFAVFALPAVQAVIQFK